MIQNKKIFFLIPIILISVVLFSKYIYGLEFSTKKMNQYSFKYFPLDNPEAEYFIEKTDGTYSLHYYGKGRARTIQGNPQDDKVLYIGHSSVNLDAFIDVPVSINGAFVEGHPLCTASCPNYIVADKRLVLRIDSAVLR